MPPAQKELLLRLIEAERRYHWLVERGEQPDLDWRGVEVGGLSGVSLATAQSLERAGLIEIVDVSRYVLGAFLGACSEYEPVQQS